LREALSNGPLWLARKLSCGCEKGICGSAVRLAGLLWVAWCEVDASFVGNGKSFDLATVLILSALAELVGMILYAKWYVVVLVSD